ncbi:hypothetical protein U0070_010445, partial [Myodes glareolus]
GVLRESFGRRGTRGGTLAAIPGAAIFSPLMRLRRQPPPGFRRRQWARVTVPARPLAGGGVGGGGRGRDRNRGRGRPARREREAAAAWHGRPCGPERGASPEGAGGDASAAPGARPPWTEANPCPSLVTWLHPCAPEG